MASIAIMLGGAVLNASTFIGGSYLAKYLSGSKTDQERRRHDKATENNSRRLMPSKQHENNSRRLMPSKLLAVAPKSESGVYPELLIPADKRVINNITLSIENEKFEVPDFNDEEIIYVLKIS